MKIDLQFKNIFQFVHLCRCMKYVCTITAILLSRLELKHLNPTLSLA